MDSFFTPAAGCIIRCSILNYVPTYCQLYMLWNAYQWENLFLSLRLAYNLVVNVLPIGFAIIHSLSLDSCLRTYILLVLRVGFTITPAVNLCVQDLVQLIKLILILIIAIINGIRLYNLLLRHLLRRLSSGLRPTDVVPFALFVLSACGFAHYLGIA